MSQAIQTEVIDPENSMALSVTEAPPPPALFGTNDPTEIVTKAAAVANILKGVIKSQGLISSISGKEYPRCEAWTLLGTMLGIFPVLIWTRKLDNGWEARVEARTRDGAIVGAAEAQCCRDERNWDKRDDFALRSMAQTRATAKCLRMPLGFVMTLAGFQPTPAEEMAFESPHNAPGASRPSTQAKNAPKPRTQAQETPKEATDKTRDWMILALVDMEQDALRYFIEAGVILPNETLEDVPLRYVPTSKPAMVRLQGAINLFKATGKCEKILPESAFKTTPKPATSPELELEPESSFNALSESEEASPFVASASIKQEPWYSFIIPVPRKGEKHDAYLKDPDTIGSLYEKRHGHDEEAAAARQRLWGFVSHYEPKGWAKKDGTQMPPSETDKKFRQMLDMFADFFAREHPDEKL